MEYLFTGQTYRFQIMASVQEASPELRSFSIQDRECRFEEEHSLEETILRSYHPSSCVFEMALRETKKNYTCVPWDLPVSHTDTDELCFDEEAERFKSTLAKFSRTIASEDCTLRRCNRVEYTAKV